MWANSKIRGFTIVELLIVIVVIAVLAAITVVAYNGTQQRTRNASRFAEASQAAKLLSAYKAANGAFPSIGSGANATCVGSGFPDFNNDSLTDCWDVRIHNVTYHPDTAFNTALQTIGRMPSGNRTVVEYPFDGNGFVGPVYIIPGGPDSNGGRAYMYASSKKAGAVRRVAVLSGLAMVVRLWHVQLTLGS